MTEIPEHLLKRAKAARDKAAETPAEPAAEPASAAPAASAEESRIPAHLLERSRAAEANAGGGDAPAEGGGGAVAVQDRVASVVQATPTGPDRSPSTVLTCAASMPSPT